MPDYRLIEQTICEILGVERRPVAIAFAGAPPEGVREFEGSEPSSCSFWRLAAGGDTFYTVPSDHLNCPIGAYTHNLLPPDRIPELEQTLGLMEGLGYIRTEEIPGVFQLPQSPKFLVYSPLGEAPLPPDIVLASGRAAGIMLLAEAAARAGAQSALPMLGRPTCMAIPAAAAHGAVASAGCIGNRVYTGIGEDELYMALRGAGLDRISAEIDTIRRANAALEQYHKERLCTRKTAPAPL